MRDFLSSLILTRKTSFPLNPSSLEDRKNVETVAERGISQAELGSFSSVEIKPIVISLSDASLQNLEPLRTQPKMKQIKKSSKLDNVLYDIRGPIMDKAKQMEAEGRRLIKLNIGNLAVFGFDPPEEVMRDMIYNLPNSAGYSDSKGMFAARKAVMHYTQDKQIEGVTLEDIYLGNGASDLITMATNALLDEGDELLVPTPDYPLWTAVTSLAGAKPVHYLCDEEKSWIPNIDDIRAKVGPRTKGIVVINPNNPTGVLYPNSVLLDIIQVARENGLVILADEVYDKILYDGIKHTSMAALSHDVLTLTFNSLSKAYRACGYRAGWMVISGDKSNAKDFIEGLNMLANMKLCANVPGQYAIQTALGGYQSINDLICEGGRLRRQRDIAYEMLSAIPGVSVVHPCASLYMFPRLDPDVYPIEDDREFFKELLEATNVVLVQGTGFNWPKPDHFRMVFLPYEWELRDAINRIAKFLADYRKRHPGKKTFPEDSVQPKSKEEIARQAALAEAKDPA